MPSGQAQRGCTTSAFGTKGRTMTDGTGLAALAVRCSEEDVSPGRWEIIDQSER